MRIAKCLLPALLTTAFSILSFAATPDRISGPIDPTKLVELKGHVIPLARPEFDQGPVESSHAMHVTMLFLPSAAQQQALNKLLAEQQDPTSPNFHKWLTPQQYGQSFGLSQGDLDKISAWLEAYGFKITYVANGRDFLSFDGVAGQVDSVFKTDLHYFNVNGKMHFANTKPPSIPAVLSGIIGGFRGLHDFTPRPMIKPVADYTFSGYTTHFLAPGDLAVIYDINPLYSLSPPVDGTGMNIVIAGQSDVYLDDIQNYRTAFGLPSVSGCPTNSSGVLQAGSCTSGNLQVVWPAGDPGVVAHDVSESDLDIQVISGVARGAQIIFVTSPASTGGVDESTLYAVDNKLAPVISYSYGLCEAFVVAPSPSAADGIYQTAESYGISFFAAAGDAASAECDADNGYTTAPAVLGLSVSYPASSPEATGVGGTEFDEGSSTYWSNGNGSFGVSALSYIPETAWNDTQVPGFKDQFDGTGGGPSNCASGSSDAQTVPPDGYSIETCNAPPNGGFPKPTWQRGSITPSDSVRDVPDISFSASNYNDPYLVCTLESEVGGGNSTASTCAGGTPSPSSAFGGTSASTPVTAAMTLLLNQYLNANGLGLINTQLYKLYAANPAGVFHDIQSGTNSTTQGASNNIVPCTKGDPTFEPTAIQCPAAGTMGYSVTGGHVYSTVTGVGSLDIYKFIQAWAATRATTTTTIKASPTTVNQGGSVTFTATVTPSTATGSVSFYNNGSTTALGSGTLSSGTATFTTSSLPAGTDSVTATYSGDANNGVSTSATPAVVTVSATTFTFTALPSSATVVAGHTTSAITLTVTPVNGFNSAVTFSCPTPPTGVTCSFPGGATVTPPATTTTMTISTLPDIATGATNVTVSATGGGVTPANQTVTLTVSKTDETFTLAAANATYTVTQGQTVAATINLTGTNGFVTGSGANAQTVEPVTYTCSETSSLTESTCTGPAAATQATSVSFMITTTAPSAKLQRPLDRGSRILYAVLLPGLLGIVLTFGSRKRSLASLRMLGMILVLGCSTLWLGSCSGGTSSSMSTPGTPQGSYTITINATTSGAVPVTGNTTFTLQVQ
jgi:hypothetical protein